MPDTGGQNVYVNQFTDALVDQGFRVTIVNRGGYLHPATTEPQSGTVVLPSGRARIVYLEDRLAEFVRKEDMAERIPAAKGLMGGFEVCGSLIYSDPAKRSVFGIAERSGLGLRLLESQVGVGGGGFHDLQLEIADPEARRL